MILMLVQSATGAVSEVAGAYSLSRLCSRDVEHGHSKNMAFADALRKEAEGTVMPNYGAAIWKGDLLRTLIGLWHCLAHAARAVDRLVYVYWNGQRVTVRTPVLLNFPKVH
jgi:hypothetical protein